MTADILVAIISAIATILAVIITNNKTSSQTDAKLDKQQAVMETKIDMLASEVREHNNFAKRMPVVEEQIKVINHRLEDLERK